MKLFIHIGIGKTGTTSIQDALFLDKNLHKKNIMYPRSGLSGSGHHNLAELAADTPSAIAVRSYERLVEEISGYAGNVIISSENFCYMRPSYVEKVAEYLLDFSPQIIFYVRRQDYLIESTFLQWQKMGWDYKGSIDKFITTYADGFDFNNRVKSWVDYFGKDSLIARVFDKSVVGGDVCKDFVSLVDPNVEIEGRKEYSNTSLLPEYSYLVSLADKVGVSAVERKSMIENYLLLSNKYRKFSTHKLLGAEQRKSVVYRYREANKKFCDNYLDDKQSALLLS